MKTSRIRNLALLLVLGAAGVLAIFAAVTAASAGQDLRASCCVAGRFRGHRADTPSRTCPTPKADDSSMNISQELRCGMKVWGDVRGDHDADHPAQNWTGTVKPSLTKKGCCEIKGGFSKPGESVEWTITLCKKDGKWVGAGTYKQTHGLEVCNGTLTIHQI